MIKAQIPGTIIFTTWIKSADPFYYSYTKTPVPNKFGAGVAFLCQSLIIGSAEEMEMRNDVLIRFDLPFFWMENRQGYGQPVSCRFRFYSASEVTGKLPELHVVVRKIKLVLL